MESTDIVRGSEQEEGSDRRPILDVSEHLLVVWNAELSKDGLVKTQQIWFFFNSIHGTPQEIVAR